MHLKFTSDAAEVGTTNTKYFGTHLYSEKWTNKFLNNIVFIFSKANDEVSEEGFRNKWIY